MAERENSIVLPAESGYRTPLLVPGLLPALEHFIWQINAGVPCVAPLLTLTTASSSPLLALLQADVKADVKSPLAVPSFSSLQRSKWST
jgi:hypothetical protein